jgi:hypothetical protein
MERLRHGGIWSEVAGSLEGDDWDADLGGGPTMWTLRRLGLSFAVLLCLVAVGCRGASAPGSGDASKQQASGVEAAEVRSGHGDPGQGSTEPDASHPSQASAGTPAVPGSPGAVGAPGERSRSAQAKGAPIRIPTFLHDQGRPLAEVRSELVSGITRQCGGVLCLKLRDEAREGSGYDSCTFWKTEPDQESTVRRGTTVVIVSGTGPCATEPTVQSPSTTDTEPDDTTPPTSGPDGTQPPATGSPGGPPPTTS